MFDQNKEFAEQLAVLNFIPYIKPLDDGFKYLDIFENTCSETGRLSIRFKDDLFEVVKTNYGHPQVQKDFTNMMDCLKYVYDNHPYTLRGKKY